MICNTKSEFLTSLRVALERNNVADRTDILTDFRQHFDDGEAAGETEAEVCRKLGDIEDIIRQYITEDADRKASEPDASGFGGNDAPQYSAPPPQYGNMQDAQQPQPTQFQPDGGKIAGIICLDVFVYSWALPALAGVIIGLYGATFGIASSGIAIFIMGILSFFIDLSGILSTGFASLSLVFLGLMFTALGGMLVIASIAATKGFINIIIAIVNHHAKIFVGHKIWNKLGKKNKEVQAQ